MTPQRADYSRHSVREVKREKSGIDTQYTDCVVCGAEIVLYWNGGELDFCAETDCCGHRYWREHTDDGPVLIVQLLAASGEKKEDTDG